MFEREDGREFCHHQAKGAYREAQVRDWLQGRLGGRYGVWCGEAVNVEGRCSGQQDVLVTDALRCTPLLAAAPYGRHPIESVLAAIEVKSVLRTIDVGPAADHVATVTRLLPGRRPTPFTGIVAYAAEGGTATVARAFRQHNAGLPPPHRVDALLVLDRFVLWWRDKAGRPSLMPLLHQLVVQPQEDHSATRFFAALLGDRLDRYEPPPLQRLAYVR